MIRELTEKMKKERFILFLGAGFNYNAKTSRNNNIPLGNDLKLEIIKNFLKIDRHHPHYLELLDYSLSDLAQYSKREKNYHDFNNFLIDIFTNTKPLNYHEDFTIYPWKKIYTTNIDDLVENIYRDSGKELIIQNSRIKTNTNSLRMKNTLEYIKLHGCVNNKSGGFVFSRNEYLDSMMTFSDYRFNSFSMDMLTHSFLFVGSEFDEMNLDYILNQYMREGTTTMRGDIYFVNPKPSLKLKAKIKDIKGNLIQMTAKNFIEEIKRNDMISIVDEYKDREIYHHQFYTWDFVRSEICFKGKKEYKSKLFFGYEALWMDIFYDYDFITPQVKKVITNVESLNCSFTFNYYGDSFTGKTTFIMRLFEAFSKLNYETLYYFGPKLSSAYLKTYITRIDKPLVVFIDNGYQSYGKINEIIEDFRNKKIIFITTSRKFMHVKKRHLLPHMRSNEIDFRLIFNKELNSVISKKLEEKGLLGAYKKLTHDERIELFSKKNDIISILYGISNSDIIRERIQDQLKDILYSSNKKDSFASDLLLKLAIFDTFDLPYFELNLLKCVHNHSDKRILFDVDDFLMQYDKFSADMIEKVFEAKNFFSFDFKSKRLKIRSDVTSEIIIDTCSSKQIVLAIKEVLLFIAPQISEYDYNAYKQIFEALCRYKLLTKRLKLSPSSIEQLFKSVMSSYEDTSFYWLQRGLFEQDKKDFDVAYNYILQAESINPKSYQIHHARGRNLLRMANNSDDLTIAYAYFIEGEKVLKDLIRKESNRRNPEYLTYSVHSYIFEKIQFYSHMSVDFNQEKKDTLIEDLNMIKKCLSKDRNDKMIKDLIPGFKKLLCRAELIESVGIDIDELAIVGNVIDYSYDATEIYY